MTLRIPIGIDDFRKVREDKLEYVDKSDFIRQVINRHGVEVMLLPRPRRFGKSLNLSMLRYYFEKCDEDLSHLFQGLSIWAAGDEYRAHFQKYPVIYFNFKGARHASYEDCMTAIREKIADIYDAHRWLLESGGLTDVDVRRFRTILDGTASIAVLERALFDLSAQLHQHHGERVVILIDEYDEPIHAAHVHGFSPQILGFLAPSGPFSS
jgi:hypothetical protein